MSTSFQTEILDSCLQAQRVVPSAPLAIFCTDLENNIIDCNPFAETLFGFNKNEVIGKNIAFNVGEHYCDLIKSQSQKITKGDSIQPYKIVCQHKSGQLIDLIITQFPILDSKNNHIGIGAIYQNAPIVSFGEEKFKTLLESAPDAMALADEKGEIVLINAQTEKIFLYNRDELLGKKIEILMPERFRNRHPTQRSEYFRSPKFRAMGSGLELFGLRKDGTEFPVEISLSPIETSKGLLICSAIRDITEQKKHLENIRSLLKEIHHRVKNNLQIVSSLLKFQSSNIQDPKTLEYFHESQLRIRSMALVHEKLYQSQNLADIDLGSYIKDLAKILFKAYAVRKGKIQLQIETSAIHIDINKAIPCALILNELISNSLKYAFPEERTGSINVVLKQDHQNVSLLVIDNGVGLPKDFDVKNCRTLGMQIVSMLVQQLCGEIVLENGEGACFRVHFPLQ